MPFISAIIADKEKTAAGRRILRRRVKSVRTFDVGRYRICKATGEIIVSRIEIFAAVIGNHYAVIICADKNSDSARPDERQWNLFPNLCCEVIAHLFPPLVVIQNPSVVAA